ncbi:HAMP domain-containing histidine kinase [Paenibacillus athensensis]|uniref:histidine kinase n=1 Tax=Paenibacillus athensensis TaxID=1967502 RepID=A0A4Y8PX66_9BACL|nr:HAMP domain-containing sensor histidine kinase [Paenibacillus athensensis]MCD1258867.1 HAMP domain-containing histidine kinase [Paenibacillus athensensis]
MSARPQGRAPRWLSRFRQFVTPHSLHFQLLSRSLLILSVLLLLIGVSQYVLIQQYAYRDKAAGLKSQLRSIPPEAWEEQLEGHSGDPRDMDDAAGRSPMKREGTQGQGQGQHRGGKDGGNAPFNLRANEFTAIALYDEAGKLHELNPELNHEESPLLTAETYAKAKTSDPRKPTYFVATNADGVKMLVVLQPVEFRGKLLGIAQASCSIGPVQQMLMLVLVTFIFLSIVALGAALMSFLPVLRRTLVPLSQIVETVGRIDAGKLDERLPDQQGQHEIDRLSHSFNGMLERLEASFLAEKELQSQMRRFIADASHELRTPLTSIHGFLEILLRGAASNEEQLRRSLTSMYSESERLKKLVEDLLFLAKMDRTPAPRKSPGSLRSVVLEMEPQLRVLAGARTVEVDPGDESTLLFDRDKIKQVILNLFQNAVQHTDAAQGRIEVKVKPAGSLIGIAIRDNGPGIPAEHVPHLFERFYRIDASRARKYGGAGLGLAITQSIVEAHGGRIEVESRVGEGATFLVLLPLDTEGQ